jgi:uncharacterized protein YbcI
VRLRKVRTQFMRNVVVKEHLHGFISRSETNVLRRACMKPWTRSGSMSC